MSVSQTQFITAVLDPLIGAPDGLIDPNGNPAGKRFDVYRNNVVASLSDALEVAFPVVQNWSETRFSAPWQGFTCADTPPPPRY